MATNTLLTISMITREALRVLENNLTFTKTVNREYDDKYAQEGAKIGTTLNVRKPPRYVGRTGQAMSIENSVETQVAVTLSTQFGVDVEFSTQDLTLHIDDFSKRFISPAISTVANKIDADGLALYNQIYNNVGTPGTVPNAALTYLSAGAKLNSSAAPRDGNRNLVIGPDMEATIVDALKGLFQQATEIAKQYVSGQMGRALGFDWYMDQNIATHTVGAYGGTPVVAGAGQTGSSLNTSGWTATTSALAQGDVFTLANVYAVNPQSRQSTGSLQQFVVTAGVTADGGGLKTVSISPSIVTSGQLQTVTASPANGAAITMIGAASQASPQGIAHHRDAFTLVTADLQMPRNTDMAARVADKQLGISIRMVRDYAILSDQFPCRLDVLYGWAVLRPELACRVQS